MYVFSKSKLFALIGFVCLNAFFSCQKPEKPIEPEVFQPALRTVSVSLQELVLEESAELPFTIKDAAAELNYDVSSPQCQIALYFVSGCQPPFHISKIEKGSAQGEYTAFLEKDITNTYFAEDIKLELKTPKATMRSESVLVKSNGIEYPVYTGLPIIYVDTQGGAAVNSKEDWVPATVKISGLGDFPDLPETAASIRGRGNTTWTWPKKPYALKFDSKTEVLGMPKHKRWVLLANFMDRTMMRNALAFHLASLTSLAWTPRNQYCELILNGKHMGNYLLTEQIKVDSKRVAIDEDNAGSFLFESDFHYDNVWQWREYMGNSWQSGGNIPFSVSFPDDDELTPEGFTQAKDYIHNVMTVLYGENFADPATGYRAYLDVDSFIDYWIIYEVMTNHELNNPGSVYSHVDSGGKWTAGPVWDFDWGGLSYFTSPQAKNGLVCWDAVWYARLNDDPWFCEKLKARWNELLPLLKQQTAFIDGLKSKLTKSAELNFAMWNPADDASQNGGNIINGDENLPFSLAVDRLRSNYNEHLNVISSKLK